MLSVFVIIIYILIVLLVIITSEESHNGLAMCKFNNEHMGFNYNFEL